MLHLAARRRVRQVFRDGEVWTSQRIAARRRTFTRKSESISQGRGDFLKNFAWVFLGRVTRNTCYIPVRFVLGSEEACAGVCRAYRFHDDDLSSSPSRKHVILRARGQTNRIFVSINVVPTASLSESGPTQEF